MSPQVEIQLIAVIVSLSCSLVGAFLVLRKMAMMADSITHTILLGIVLAFFVTHDLSSPFLIVGAALMGVFTVWLTEALHKTGLVAEDAAIGVVFPLLFSIAIILINRYAGSVHLDADSVLLGEIAFAPFDRMVVNGVDIGAKAIYTTGALLLLNLAFVVILFKELKLATFDPMLAAVLGFSPTLIHYLLMSLVSLTTVGSFQAVGSILVLAFMIGPPVTAYLLTSDLKKLLALSGFFGILNPLIGYQVATMLDVSIAGSIACTIGLSFLAAFILSPKKGLIRTVLLQKTQKIDFAKLTLLFHLYNHEGKKEQETESALQTLPQHFNWTAAFTDQIVQLLEKEDMVKKVSEHLMLTEKGRNAAITASQEIFGKISIVQ